MELNNLNQSFQHKYFESLQRTHAGDDRSPVIKKLSKKYLGSKVLDVGAANGKLINIIPNATGIDLSPRHPDVIEGDITNTDFDDEQFDTIFCLEVLEHMNDQVLKAILEEIYRILKLDGYLIISTPANERLEDNLTMCPECGEWFHSKGHVRSFSENSIKKLLKSHGFSIVSLKKLPLGSLGRHSFLGYFWKLFNYLNLGFKPTSFFAVVQKKRKEI